MFSIFTYVMSRVTHSEPGLPMEQRLNSVSVYDRRLVRRKSRQEKNKPWSGRKRVCHNRLLHVSLNLPYSWHTDYAVCDTCRLQTCRLADLQTCRLADLESQHTSSS